MTLRIFGLNRIRSSLLCAALLAIASLMGSTGCAVLTEPQVEAVANFARATEQYAPLPSEAFRSYRTVFLAARKGELRGHSADSAWSEALEDNRRWRRIEERARETDAALKVLNRYATLLEVLSSGRFSSELAASVEDLGDSFDDAVDTYNETTGSELSGSLGGAVAAAVRGVGGLYLRRRQTTALKRAVTDAQGHIEHVTSHIQGGMESFTIAEVSTAQELEIVLGKQTCGAGPTCTGLLCVEANIVLESLCGGGVESLEEAAYLQNLIRSIEDANTVARRVSSTAESYRETHAKLVEAVADKGPLLDEARVAVEALKVEVDAAREVYETYD